jgi:hypothetical protein
MSLIAFNCFSAKLDVADRYRIVFVGSFVISQAALTAAQ